jgi:CheY-like chemotaxis protein
MKKVLIIEDDEAVRENTAELLAISNYDVVTAENGRTGFEEAKKCRPDVVLCDMMMPETDGRTFIKLIKADSDLQHVPVIFFSAGTLSARDQNNLINSGNGFLKKPFLEEDLLGIVQHVLDRGSAAFVVV